MTIIDTTLYANGALRLSRHGAGKGGNVLVHVRSGAQLEISDVSLASVVALLDTSSDAEGDFNYISAFYTVAEGAERTYDGKRYKVVDHQIVPADAPATASPGWYHN